MWKLCLGIVFIILIFLDKLNPPLSFLEYNEVRWLSYIPPLNLNSVEVEMEIVSLKKVDFLNDTEQVDKYAELEKFVPVIDKLLHIPDGYHAYSSTG
jgi:hypothetical protein